jgi:hypothetical protein
MTAVQRHFGVSGTRTGMSAQQRSAVLFEFNHLHAIGFRYQHNGDCVGSDKQFFDLWKEYYTSTISYGHPPVNSKYRAFCDFDIANPPKPYGVRDKDICVASECLVATPNSMTEAMIGSGTWKTVRYMRTLQRPICIILPNGTIQRESWNL